LFRNALNISGRDIFCVLKIIKKEKGNFLELKSKQ
jgi:hypothetical protein